MLRLEVRKSFAKIFFLLTSRRKDSIYYYRELLTFSLEGLRIDLITVTDFHGIQDTEEPHFDEKLFPNKSVPRCKNFINKKVWLLSWLQKNCNLSQYLCVHCLEYSIACHVCCEPICVKAITNFVSVAGDNNRYSNSWQRAGDSNWFVRSHRK